MKRKDDVFELEALQSDSLKKAKISKEMVFAIYTDYIANEETLRRQAEYFSNILHMGKDVNSVKWRVKDPIHLLTKIVRKRKEALLKVVDSPYLHISVDNYKSIVNDLVGLRAIYLFKADWSLVNEFILSNFSVLKDEVIKIYHAKDDDISLYSDAIESNSEYKYDLFEKDSRYRSTHYIIKSIPPQNFSFELQTRTILDEAWGEIDHHIRYPDFEYHEELQRKMSVLNGTISGCEELASNFYEYFKILQMELMSNDNNVDDDDDDNKNDDDDDNNNGDDDSKEVKSKSGISDSDWDEIIESTGNSIKRDRVLNSIKHIHSNRIFDSLADTSSIASTMSRALTASDLDLSSLSASNRAFSSLNGLDLSSLSATNKALSAFNDLDLSSLSATNKVLSALNDIKKYEAQRLATSGLDSTPKIDKKSANNAGSLPQDNQENESIRIIEEINIKDEDSSDKEQDEDNSKTRKSE